MENETLQKILQQREIKTTDDIIFRTIFDVLSALFTDENHLSTLRVVILLMIINKYDFQILHSHSDLQLKLKRDMPII